MPALPLYLLVRITRLAAIPAILMIVGQESGIDLIERISRLSTSALFVLFIYGLMTGKLRWERELVTEILEKEAWKEAALGRAADSEKDASVLEAALERGRTLGRGRGR